VHGTNGQSFLRPGIGFLASKFPYLGRRLLQLTIASKNLL
jgi:hypothetical protein